MVNKSIIMPLKHACIGIGLRKIGDPLPLHIGGTGFVVDPDGFVITANHVISELKQIRNQENKKGNNIEIAGFVFETEGEDLKLFGIPIKEIRRMVIAINDLKDYIPEDHDVAICRLIGKWGKLPTLYFKKPAQLNVYDEIILCGYAGGNASFNPIDKKHGFRTSPLIQTGRISSLMPTDSTTRPIGIQTDIIGTGGSSGSPIVNAEDGEVIGIAQRVISSTVFDFNNVEIGSSAVGLVWGVSNYFLYDNVKKLIEMMKKVVDENGEPLEEMKDKHILKTSYTAGEGSFPDLK